MTSRGRHLRHRPVGARLLRSVWPAVQMAAVVVALAVIGLPLVTDYEWRSVATGSMSPAIQAGDVVLTAPAEGPATAGEVVVFTSPVQPGREIVHRVVEASRQGVSTKGDANAGLDPWTIAESDISGRVVARVPMAGFAVEAVSSRAGVILFLMLPALGILATEARVWYRFIRHGPEAFEPPRRGRHTGIEMAA